MPSKTVDFPSWYSGRQKKRPSKKEAKKNPNPKLWIIRPSDALRLGYGNMVLGITAESISDADAPGAQREAEIDRWRTHTHTLPNAYVYMYISIYLYIYISIYLYIYMYVCMDGWMNGWMDVACYMHMSHIMCYKLHIRYLI